MIRELINIGNLPYVVDLFDAYEDDFIHYDQFVMFRNYDVYNDVFADKELYFVDKAYWEDDYYREQMIWPICEELGGGFATDYKYFNGLFSDYGLEQGYDVNILYNKFKHIANVRCNRVRIYRPAMKNANNVIIHINNFINNINVHYLCRTYDSYDVKSSEEFKVNNITYSEYIELYFPNIYDLFDNDKLNNHIGCYFKENLNMIEMFTNVKENLLLLDDEKNNVYFPLDIFSLPYILKEKEHEGYTYTVKCYTTVAKSIENNYLSYPVNISLWSYSGEILNNKYIKDEYWGEASATFQKKLRFTLSANLGFVDNKVSVITKFIYPELDEYDEDSEDSKVLQAYMKYNNVKKEHYSDYKIEAVEKYKEELENTTLTEDDEIIVLDYYKRRGVDLNYKDHKLLREKYKEMKLQSLYEEMNEDNDTSIDFIGFRIIIGSDPNFKHIIYDYNVKINFTELDDFAFNIDDMFESWNNVYDGYYAVKVLFVDRLLGTEILSNSVVISPEWVKFMINSSNERILDFDNINNNEDMANYNFIENIRCVVNKKQDDKEKVTRGNNSPKILYKPIFYRASNLQNVSIRRNIKQKIGINLAEFMTKVGTFKMLLNGVEYIEFGRADAFVIFEVSGNNFSNVAGMYDILNQDDEYIASGNYVLI